ncbi:hypothetical protein [Streptomyces sp. SS]|uniref:hypothetical protein n=1 Tax=Streptomyces sp. SS TaxID=260742 RepID=UPI000311252F|nr:hypothetical protein [Streptomyces sp. SS]
MTVLPRRTVSHACLLVFTVDRAGTGVVVKYPRTEGASAALALEWDHLRGLTADRRLAPWRPLLPEAVGRRPDAGPPHRPLVQTRLPGGAPDSGGDPAALALPTWLWHVSGNLRRTRRFGRSRRRLGVPVTPVPREAARSAGTP